MRRIGRAVGTRILILAGLGTRRKRVATRPTRSLGLDFSYGFFERQTLAGYVGLAQGRLNATQLRKEGRTRPII
jgi:hypothetical protein